MLTQVGSLSVCVCMHVCDTYGRLNALHRLRHFSIELKCCVESNVVFLCMFLAVVQLFNSSHNYIFVKCIHCIIGQFEVIIAISDMEP